MSIKKGSFKKFVGAALVTGAAVLAMSVFSCASKSALPQRGEVYEQAVREIETENFSRAIELLKSIQHTDDYMVFHYLGVAHYFLDNDESAQLYLARSIELNNDFVSSHGYLAMSYFHSGNLDAAQTHFLRCVELNKTNFRDYYFLGKIHEQRGDMDSALHYLSRAMEYNDSDFQTIYSIANIYFDRDDYDNARKYFELADGINDGVYPVVSCLIRIKYRQGDLDDIDAYKTRLRTIRQNTDDERLRRLRHFTIDTFTHNDLQINVSEIFDPDPSADLYYYWIFNVYDGDENFIKRVNLESSSAIRALGLSYIVGTDRFEPGVRIHQSTNITFTELPEYSVMKNIVIEAIEKGLSAAATGIYPTRTRN